MRARPDDPNAPPSHSTTEDKKPRNSKRTGELSEAAFLHKAVALGFRVTKPWGDSERYDFVLDSGRRLWRVQIKCTAVSRAGGYHIQPIHFVYGKNKVVYTAEDIDVLAAHVVPLDIWYVVPVGVLALARSSIRCMIQFRWPLPGGVRRCGSRRDFLGDSESSGRTPNSTSRKARGGAPRGCLACKGRSVSCARPGQPGAAVPT